jgi:hypothetical protein
MATSLIDADLNNNQATVKLVPRIDYAQLEQIQRQHDQDDDSHDGSSERRVMAVAIGGWQSMLTASKKRLSYRPLQAEFDSKNVRDFGSEMNQKDHMMIKKRLKIYCCFGAIPASAGHSSPSSTRSRPADDQPEPRVRRDKTLH